MNGFAPLPESTRRLVERCTHPGLILDKFAPTWTADGPPGKLSEDVQKPTLTRVVERTPHRDVKAAEFIALRQRFQTAALSGRESCVFTCTTTGPLTLHLARASALENAGICLHPIYGFVYLPGSGLKGMARAYATTVWLAQQADKKIAWTQIEDVFGWAPTPERRALFKDNSHPAEPRIQNPLDVNSPEIREHSGQIIFHDAWPTTWPKLEVDILNNHHHEYYSANDGDNDHPPGDWENPVPVYFLSVPAGATFEFVLGKRRDDVADDLLARAQEWLLGGLCHLGAGAKTASGYGSFKPADAANCVPSLAGSPRVSFETTLELVTPAFLAGANQKEEDCDLRPATLRGVLRWWWRTMHSGFVDAATLRRMEAAIWGDTNQGGAVRMEVSPISICERFERPGKVLGRNKRQQEVLVDDNEFLDANDIVRPPRYTTQGLFYASYGTDEMKPGDVASRKHRWCVAENSKWRLRLIVRPWTYEESDHRGRVTRREIIDAPLLLEQAKAALWLLCQYGCVGAKGRKGFGSLKDVAEMSSYRLKDVEDNANRFRESWQERRIPFRPGSTGTAALERAQFVEKPTPWKNPWFVLDQIGALAQDFAQSPKESGHGKHCSEKAALGLPRKVHGPLPYALGHQKEWSPPIDLVGPKGDRHAAPIVYHVGKNADGQLIIRAAVFFTDFLWNADEPESQARQKSGEVLKELASHIAKGVENRSREHRARGQKRSSLSHSTVQRPAPGQSPKSSALPKVGDVVEAELLAEKTKKDGWRARHVESQIAGPIQNTNDVPPDKNVGDRVQLIVRSANPKEIAFRYPSEEELARSKATSTGPSRTGPGRGAPRGGTRRQ